MNDFEILLQNLTKSSGFGFVVIHKHVAVKVGKTRNISFILIRSKVTNALSGDDGNKEMK